MRFDQKTNRQRADSLAITKLSNVTRPAHQGALATIIKSAAVTPEEVEKLRFDDALAEIQMDDLLEEFFEQVWDMTWALRMSIKETLDDEEVENKRDVIQQNIQDFATALSGVVSANNVIKQGEEDMKKEEIDAMIKAAVDPLQAKLTTAEAVAKMNDDTKVYYKFLDADGQEAFLKMSAEDQQSAVEKANEHNLNKGDDESVVLHGQTIMKSEVGAAIFAVMKAQQAEIEKAREETRTEKAARETAEFAKQAEALYGNLPGEVTIKGKSIQAIHKMDADVRECVLGMLKSGNEAIANAQSFNEIGHNYVSPGADTPTAKLNKMAEAKAEKDGITFAKAYTAVLDTEEGNKLYQQSLRG